MKFEINHTGRSGFIKCIDGDKELKLGISCENPYGYFGVYFLGIRKNKRELIKKELRLWLDATERNNWYFE